MVQNIESFLAVISTYTWCGSGRSYLVPVMEPELAVFKSLAFLLVLSLSQIRTIKIICFNPNGVLGIPICWDLWEKERGALSLARMPIRAPCSPFWGSGLIQESQEDPMTIDRRWVFHHEAKQ